MDVPAVGSLSADAMQPETLLYLGMEASQRCTCLVTMAADDEAGHDCAIWKQPLQRAARPVTHHRPPLPCTRRPPASLESWSPLHTAYAIAYAACGADQILRSIRFWVCCLVMIVTSRQKGLSCHSQVVYAIVWTLLPGLWAYHLTTCKGMLQGKIISFRK